MDASALDNAISVLEKSISSLESSVDSLDFWLWLSTAAVVIGVALELYFVIEKYRSDRKAWWRASIRSPEKPSAGIFISELTSIALVVLGVAGELVVGVVSANKNAELRNKTGVLVALIREKASNAERLAGEATERAARLEKEAAEISESVAPRRLTKKQRALLASQLAKVAGRNVTIFSDPSDAEAAVFASDIYLTLKSAKWGVGKSPVARGGGTSMTVAPAMPSTGVDIPCGPPALHEAAGRALVRELSRMGFDSQCSARYTGMWPLEVLARPEGPQGEAKTRREREAKITQKQNK
jgi:hypothetical protein